MNIVAILSDTNTQQFIFFQMTIYCTNVKLKAIRVKQPQKTQFAPTIPGGGGPTASLGGAIVMAIGG